MPGKHDKALKKMRAAAEAQDRDDPGPLSVTAREMLGDMLLELHQPAAALVAYETVLKLAPNRFNPLYGAAAAADLAGDSNKAKSYFSKLRENCPAQADREELQNAKAAATGNNWHQALFEPVPGKLRLFIDGAKRESRFITRNEHPTARPTKPTVPSTKLMATMA